MPGQTNNGGRSGSGKSSNNNRGKGGPSSNHGGGVGSSNKQLLMDSLRDACPEYRHKDLEHLVKSLNGDEEKIRLEIQRWWEEPAGPVEGEWEDVNKKATKKKVPAVPEGKLQHNNNRGERGGGAFGRDGRGGRGRGGRGRGGPSRGGRHSPPTSDNHRLPKSTENPNAAMPEDDPPVGSVRVAGPVGAWSKKADVAATAPADEIQEALETEGPPVPSITILPPPPEQAQTPVVEPPPAAQKPAVRTAVPSGNVWATKGSAHLIQAEKPKPPAPIAPIARSGPSKALSPAPPPPPMPPASPPMPAVAAPQPTPSSPIPPPQPTSIPEVEEHSVISEAVPAHPESKAPPVASPKLDPVGPAVLTATVIEPGAWKQTPPVSSISTVLAPNPSAIEIPAPQPPASPPPTSSVAVEKALVPTVVAEQPSTTPVPPPSVPSAPTASKAPSQARKPVQLRSDPSNVLNLGHWELGDSDDHELDFGFGSFGNEMEAGSMDATTASSSTSNVPVSAAAAAAAAPSARELAPTQASATSAARPPPGLSISGMPPMPAGAVLVHELENKLEQSSLEAVVQAPPVPDKSMGGTLPPQPVVPHEPSVVAAPTLAHQPYNSQPYGINPYSYSTAAPGNAFVGMPGAGGPVLGTGVFPQQQPKPQAATVANLQPPPGGLYGAPHQPSQPAPSSGNALTTGTSSSPNDTSTQATTAGIPPGMPTNMAYNPPMFYQQQPFHLGQQHTGLGYNYGYGQFGGAVQGGFGYPQQMGQSGGYGPSVYDDQTGTSHSSAGGAAGYQKNNGGLGGGGGGGYRGGRNSHHTNQYGTQYNPQQHGGYGGQPYGMGYHNDHFGQRGGYAGMQDPYGMQQQQQLGGSYGGGFQEDDRYKGGGKKGNRGGGALQQFQQQGPPPGQLGGGASGSGADPQGGFSGLHHPGSSDSQPAGGGSGGWSNNQGGGGGWSSGGGAPRWQGK